MMDAQIGGGIVLRPLLGIMTRVLLGVSSREKRCFLTHGNGKGRPYSDLM